MKTALLALALATFGCAHYGMTCPAAGGPEWVEATSTHFVLRTDLPPDQAEVVLDNAEETLQRFVDVMDFFLPPAPALGRTSLVVFATLEQYRAVVVPSQLGSNGGGELGRFVPADERGRPTIALSSEHEAGIVFRHELAHRLLHQRLGDAPQWLDEGFAEYFSTLPAGEDKIILGGPTARLSGFVDALHDMHNPAFMREQIELSRFLLTQMLLADKKYGYTNLGYLLAWALVHQLANGSTENAPRFRAFLADLNAGKPWREALVAQYGPLPELLEKVHQHLYGMREGIALQWTLSYTRPPKQSWATSVRSLDDAEMHHLQAALRPAIAGKQLQLAETHAPDSAELHRWLALRAAAGGDDGQADREMARAAELRDAPFYRFERARLAFARELKKPEAERNLAPLADEMRAAARLASEPDQLTVLARYYELVHEATFGLAFANRAVAMDPTCTTCLVALASLALASGDPDDAVKAQQAAVRRWPSPTVPTEVTAKLKQYECAAAQAKGAPCSP